MSQIWLSYLLIDLKCASSISKVHFCIYMFYGIILDSKSEWNTLSKHDERVPVHFAFCTCKNISFDLHDTFQTSGPWLKFIPTDTLPFPNKEQAYAPEILQNNLSSRHSCTYKNKALWPGSCPTPKLFTVGTWPMRTKLLPWLHRNLLVTCPRRRPRPEPWQPSNLFACVDVVCQAECEGGPSGWRNGMGIRVVANSHPSNNSNNRFRAMSL